MVKVRGKYELSGIEVTYADANLRKIADFEKPRRVCFPGGCNPVFYCLRGRLKDNKDVRIIFYQRHNRGRILVRYDDQQIKTSEVDSMVEDFKKPVHEQGFWEGLRRGVEGVVEGIQTTDPFLFSDNQMVY